MSSVEPNRNIYVGHRYVPKIFGEWDNVNEYEGLSIVTHQGASYTSKKRVPVGIDILNEEYWVVTGNYDAQVEHYRDETVRVSNDLAELDDRLTNETSSTRDYVDQSVGILNNDLDGRGLNIKKHYNVIGDGVNNDSPFINQAIQENDYIYIPTGIYALNSPVTIPVNKKVDISEDTLFLIKGNFNGFEIHSKAEVNNLRVEIDDDNYDSTAVVIYNEGEENPQLRGGIKKLRVVNKHNTFKGNAVEIKPSNNSGIAWMTNDDWFIDGFKNALYFNSNDGWINSNIFENVGIYRSTNVVYMPTPELITGSNGEIAANEIINLHIQSHHVHERSILMGNSSRYNKVGLMVWDWLPNHPDGGIDIELQTGSTYNDIDDRSHFQSRFLDEGNNNVSGRNHKNSTKVYNVRSLTSDGIVRSTRVVDDELFEAFMDVTTDGAYMYFRKNQSDIVGSVSINNDGEVLLNGKKALTGLKFSIPIDVTVPVNDVVELVLDAPGVKWKDSVSVGATFSMKERPKVLFSAFVSANDKITVRFLNMNDTPSILRDTYNFNVIH